MNRRAALGLSLAAISLLGFALSQLYILKTLDEYARQVGEWIKKAAIPCVTVEIVETEESPQALSYPVDVVGEVGSVNGFHEAIEQWYTDEYPCGKGIYNVTLYLHDYYYWVFLKDESSIVRGVIRLNLKINSPYYFLSEILSIMGAALGVVLALCITWSSKNTAA